MERKELGVVVDDPNAIHRARGSVKVNDVVGLHHDAVWGSGQCGPPQRATSVKPRDKLFFALRKRAYLEDPGSSAVHMPPAYQTRSVRVLCRAP